MNRTPQFDSYSELERRLLTPLRGLAASIWRPFVIVLARLGVTPNMVSLAQIPLGLIAFILMTVAPPWAVPVWVLSVAIDGLDGALARHLGMASRYGALVDQYADHARESIIVAGLAWAGALNGAWATLYVLTYIGVNITLLLCNIHSVPLPLSVKTIFILYPAILVYLLMGVNALDAAALLMIAIQSLTISIGLRRLRPVLQGSIA